MTFSPYFERYLLVDYSAANSPRQGKDSIWILQACWRKRRLYLHVAWNPPTRVQAQQLLRELLLEAVRAEAFTLVGVDFALAYPRGFAQALGLGQDSSEAGWLAVWRLLRDLVREDDSNRSNRFEVAAELNRRLGAPQGPFWGCPQPCPHLARTRPRYPCRTASGLFLEEFRQVDAQLRQKGRAIQSGWKLYGRGSVGSQNLLGIPRLLTLREDADLAPHLRIWPFEPDSSLITVTEIWPGICDTDLSLHAVKDVCQLRTLVQHLANLDAQGELASLLAEGERHREEGWILGVFSP